MLQSAEGWIRDYNIDGLRLDAIHSIYDSSAEHIVAEIVRRVHAVRDDALGDRRERPQRPARDAPDRAGRLRLRRRLGRRLPPRAADLLTGDREGYYDEFGRISQLAKAFHRPHVHDGNYSEFRRRRFGAPRRRRAAPDGSWCSRRTTTRSATARSATDCRRPCAPLAAFCTLLSPFVPMLFMGEEYGEPAPFQFFSDHIDKRIADATREGRRREFAAFAEFEEDIPDPQDPATFERSKLTRERDPATRRAVRAAARRSAGACRRATPTRSSSTRSCGGCACSAGAFEILCNFADEPRRVPCEGTSVQLSTHEPPQPLHGFAELPPMSGALVR